MTEEKKEESGGVSRREFLRDAGLLVGWYCHRLGGTTGCLWQ